MWKYRDKINGVFFVLFVIIMMMIQSLAVVDGYKEVVLNSTANTISQEELWYKVLFGFGGSTILFMVLPIFVSVFTTKKYHEKIHSDVYYEEITIVDHKVHLRKSLFRGYLISGLLYLFVSVTIFVLLYLVKDYVNNPMNISSSFVILNVLIILFSFVMVNILHLLMRIRKRHNAYLVITGIGFIFLWWFLSMFESVVEREFLLTPHFFVNQTYTETFFSFAYSFWLVPVTFIGTYYLVQKLLGDRNKLKLHFKNFKKSNNRIKRFF